MAGLRLAGPWLFILLSLAPLGGLAEPPEPPSLVLPRSFTDFSSFLRRHVRRWSPTAGRPLPHTAEGLREMLEEAQAMETLHVGRAQVLQLLQRALDHHGSGNLYLLLGNVHSSSVHWRYLTDLIGPQGLKGITHLGLETFGSGSPVPAFVQRDLCQRLRQGDEGLYQALMQENGQVFLDCLMDHGDPGLREMLGRFHREHFSSDRGIVEDVMESVLVARRVRPRTGLDVVATDLPWVERLSQYHILDPLEVIYDIREARAIHAVRTRLWQRGRRAKRNAILMMWGRAHVEGGGLRRFVPQGDQVVAVALFGGGPGPDMWDQAAASLGLRDLAFAVELKGYNIADLVIHFPPIHRQGQSEEAGRLFESTEHRSPRSSAYSPSRASEALIFGAVHRLRSTLRRCYESYLRRGASGEEGQVLLDVEVYPSGAVSEVTVRKDTFASSHVAACVAHTLRSRTLPCLKESQPVKVTIPLDFVTKE